MTETPYSTAKRVASFHTFLALLLMLFGFVIATKAPPIGFLITLYAVVKAARSFSLLIRLAAAEQVLQSEPHTRLRQAYQRASLPRKIFLLLYSVAEVDGQAEARERELVRDFLISRFQRPDLLAEIRDWDAEALPEAELRDLVHELRTMLSRPECETVFTWCCLVALIDEKFRESEHEILQRIARHIGLPPHHARRLFLYAKNRVLQSGTNAGWASGRGSSSRTGAGNGRNRQQHGHRARRPQFKPPRDHALEVLGLEQGASHESIRKRHRELVKKYHPDAHSHLGDVAAQEATERFREIQSAYETLTA